MAVFGEIGCEICTCSARLMETHRVICYGRCAEKSILSAEVVTDLEQMKADLGIFVVAV